MWRDRRRNWDYNPHAMRSDGKPDIASGSLAGDHTRPRATHRNTHADRLLHGTCNKQRGDGTRDHLRPALTAHQQPEDPVLGVRIFDWP